LIVTRNVGLACRHHILRWAGQKLRIHRLAEWPTQLGSSSEPNTFPARISWNPNVHSCVHNSPTTWSLRAKSTFSHHICLLSILISTSHLRLGLLSGLFHPGTFNTLLPSACYALNPTIFFLNSLF
jgi:hypothetical protein